MYKTFLFFLFFSFIFSKSPYQIENDVLDLNERTFSIAIREFKNLVILFYDPECPHCEKIMPEYEKAAADLTKENFVLSKLDSIKAKKIADRYGIEKLPTIKIVQSSEVLKMYDGNGKADDIEKWVKDTTKPEFKTIKTKDELESLKKFHKVLLVLFGKSEKTMKELILAERIIDDVPFVIADSDELIQEYKQKNRTEFIYIFKQFDDNKVFMKEKITSKNIIKFCHLFSQPKVIEFSKDNSNLIFIKRNPALVIFSIKSERHYEDSVNLFNYMWKNTKDKIRLVVVDIKDPDGAK